MRWVVFPRRYVGKILDKELIRISLGMWFLDLECALLPFRLLDLYGLHSLVCKRPGKDIDDNPYIFISCKSDVVLKISTMTH